MLRLVLAKAWPSYQGGVNRIQTFCIVKPGYKGLKHITKMLEEEFVSPKNVSPVMFVNFQNAGTQQAP